MTNVELVKLVEDTVKAIFDGRKDKYEVTVKPTKHNGAWCRVCRVSEQTNYGGDFKYISKLQVGFNTTVYAIAGEENVKKRLAKTYEFYLR